MRPLGTHDIFNGPPMHEGLKFGEIKKVEVEGEPRELRGDGVVEDYIQDQLSADAMTDIRDGRLREFMQNKTQLEKIARDATRFLSREPSTEHELAAPLTGWNASATYTEFSDGSRDRYSMDLYNPQSTVAGQPRNSVTVYIDPEDTQDQPYVILNNITETDSQTIMASFDGQSTLIESTLQEDILHNPWIDPNSVPEPFRSERQR